MGVDYFPGPFAAVYGLKKQGGRQAGSLFCINFAFLARVIVLMARSRFKALEGSDWASTYTSLTGRRLRV